jgi:AraC family transcriptional regulator
MRTTIAAGTDWRRDSAALLVVLRGRVAAAVGRKRLVLGPGCAVYVPGGIRLRFETAGEVFVAARELPDIGFVADHTARAWSLNLLRELDRREPEWELMVEGLVLQGLAALSRLARLGQERPKWLDDVLDLARRQQPLGAIAAIVGRHASHIAREFRRHEGVSVGEFSRRCRLELAAATLKTGSGSIADVAIAAGFCDQSHFTNAFRRVFGVTPAAWRQSTRGY